jgi:hypothetical protein
MSNVTAKARVYVTLELDLTDTWGGDCPIEQVHKQAVDVATDEVRNLINQSRGQRIRIHDLRVQGIITEKL